MGKHSVRFEHIEADWMVVEVDGDTFVVLRPDRVSPRVLEEAWAAYRHLAHVGPEVSCPHGSLRLVG